MNHWWQIRMAVEAVRRGEVIAYPTEAVFGLGCDPYNPNAVIDLLALKQRPVEKGLIVIGADWQQLAPLVAPLGERDLIQIQSDWPGAVTWLLPVSDQTPPWLCGEYDTLAVRIPGHPLARQLCRSAGTPLVSTSANPGGLPAARNGLSVRRYFGSQLGAILNAPTGGLKRPSQIRNLKQATIIRQ